MYLWHISTTTTHPFRIVSLGLALAFLAATASASTLTVISTPEGGGAVQAGGTFPDGATVSRRIQASPTFCIQSVTVEPHGPGFLAFERAVALENLTAGGDVTKIVDVTESLTLAADTTLSVTFAPLSPTISRFVESLPFSPFLTGGSFGIEAGATGRLPLSFRWHKDDAPLAGASDTSLFVPNLTPGDSGAYTLVVSNAFGSVTSRVARVVVRDLLIATNGIPTTADSIVAVSPVTLEILSAFENGSVFYTTNGVAPDFSGIPYTAPVTISTSVSFRAIAYSADFSKTAMASLSIQFPEVVSISIAPSSGGHAVVGPNNGSIVKGETALLEAVPDPGWTFMHWEGDISRTESPLTITALSNLTVRPVFGTPIRTTAAGNGTVAVFPSLPLYPHGSRVRIEAQPSEGNHFALWGNAASGSGNPLAFSIVTANPSVSALFSPLLTNEVTLIVRIEGLGDVTTPAVNKYARGSVVSISATPQSGQSFLGWTGATNTLSPSMSLALETTSTVTAHFTDDARLLINGEAGHIELLISGKMGKRFELQSTTGFDVWTRLESFSSPLTTIAIPFPGTDTAVFYRVMEW